GGGGARGLIGAVALADVGGARGVRPAAPRVLDELDQAPGSRLDEDAHAAGVERLDELAEAHRREEVLDGERTDRVGVGGVRRTGRRRIKRARGGGEPEPEDIALMEADVRGEERRVGPRLGTPPLAGDAGGAGGRRG